jgi:integrase
VTIYQRGKSKIWCADYWHDGSHRRESLQTTNRREAISRAVKIDDELNSGTLRHVDSEVTIAAAKEQYLAYLTVEGRAKKTVGRYTGELTNLAEFCEANRIKSLAQVTPALFDRFRAMRKQSIGPKTMFHEGIVCKQFLKWCVSRHLIVDNPLKDYKIKEPPPRRRPAPAVAEVLQLFGESSPRQRELLAVLAYTGMRSGELQRLRREDVDLKQGWIHVESREGAETKTRHSRKVPIHPELRALLEKRSQSPGPWFFTSAASDKYPDGSHWISTKRLNEDFTAAAVRVGLPSGLDGNGYTIHSLRHFFENLCVHAGIPQRVIDTWLGHRADRSMAAVYYHLSDADSQRFMSQVSFPAINPSAIPTTRD